jgi:ribonuclease HII
MPNIIEQELRELGFNKIAGVDEVARGVLIGSVCTACVILPVNHRIKGIKDSKKLSEKKRTELAQLIHERAIEIRIVMANQNVIDKINILEATRRCFVKGINSLRVKPDFVVIDGAFSRGFSKDTPYPYMCRPKADNDSENVSAASIVAKHHHTQYIKKLDELYPQYGWKNNHGYGTKEHIESILKYGPTPLHRKSFKVKGKLIGDL